MGNYTSCALPTPFMKNSRATRVIFPTGEVKQYKQSTIVAELMLECPSCFIVDLRSLNNGRRFSTLFADMELYSGGVYILFPMRLNSIITTADMEIVFLASNFAAKRLKGGKVSGMPKEKAQESAAAEKEEEEAANGCDNGDPSLSLDVIESGFHYRPSCSKTRKPKLEPIDEEPIYNVRWLDQDQENRIICL